MFTRFYMCVFTPNRVQLTGEDGDLLLDYSKNIVSEKTMKLLFNLVRYLCMWFAFHSALVVAAECHGMWSMSVCVAHPRCMYTNCITFSVWFLCSIAWLRVAYTVFVLLPLSQWMKWDVWDVCSALVCMTRTFPSQARARGVEQMRDRMFSGEKINITEVEKCSF